MSEGRMMIAEAIALWRATDLERDWKERCGLKERDLACEFMQLPNQRQGGAEVSERFEGEGLEKESMSVASGFVLQDFCALRAEHSMKGFCC